MESIILSPGKYIQGDGALKNIAKYAAKKSLVISDDFVTNLTKPVIEESFLKHKIEVIFELFSGECTKEEVKRLEKIVKEKGIEMVIGVGGGKTLDTAKATAYYSHSPVMIVPTIASTDAPCTALSVFYKKDGSFDEYLFLPENPNIVLMDTDIISKAPERLLACGMGDALATYFEARSCVKGGNANLAGGLSTKAAMALAELCYKTLIEDGKKAFISAQCKSSTKALENIIEANTYLSGIGAESAGLAAAHSIHNGFTILHECHHLYHGEKVAFGTIAQLFLENSPLEEIDEVVAFCKSVNLPTNLKEMGIKEINNGSLLEVAKLACAPGETIHNTPFEVTPEMVLAAILTADRYCS